MQTKTLTLFLLLGMVLFFKLSSMQLEFMMEYYFIVNSLCWFIVALILEILLSRQVTRILVVVALVNFLDTVVFPKHKIIQDDNLYYLLDAIGWVVAFDLICYYTCKYTVLLAMSVFILMLTFWNCIADEILTLSPTRFNLIERLYLFLCILLVGGTILYRLCKNPSHSLNCSHLGP